MAEDGNQPYQWDFCVYKGDTLCYHDNKVSIEYFEWTPTGSGNYTVVVDVTDISGFKVSHTEQFTVT